MDFTKSTVGLCCLQLDSILSLLDVCPQVLFYVLAMKLAARHLAFNLAVMATLSFWSRVFIRVL